MALTSSKPGGGFLRRSWNAAGSKAARISMFDVIRLAVQRNFEEAVDMFGPLAAEMAAGEDDVDAVEDFIEDGALHPL